MTNATAPALAIRGEFTIFCAAEMKARLVETLENPATDLEIDLADVTEIDSAGLQLMVLIKREAIARGKTLRFAQHSAAVLDLLDLYDMVGFFGDPIVIRSTL